jgi:hemoglobin
MRLPHPLPPKLVKRPQTLYDAVDGLDALERLTACFYHAILAEPAPLLEPAFRGMDPNHPRHVAAWLAETFGGPQTYSLEHGGYEHMLAKHRNLALTEEQRKRWITRMNATADEVGLPAEPGLRSTFLAYLEWGTRLAVANSRPGAEVVVAILAEDVTFAMPPHPHWWRGRDDVIGAVVRTGLPDVRTLRTEANGQPAVAWYVRETPGGPYVARSNEVLCFDGERVSAIVAFVPSDCSRASGCLPN